MTSPKKRITIILVDTDYLEAALHKGRSASCNMLLWQVGYALDWYGELKVVTPYEYMLKMLEPYSEFDKLAG